VEEITRAGKILLKFQVFLKKTRLNPVLTTLKRKTFSSAGASASSEARAI